MRRCSIFIVFRPSAVVRGGRVSFWGRAVTLQGPARPDTASRMLFWCRILAAFGISLIERNEHCRRRVTSWSRTHACIFACQNDRQCSCTRFSARPCFSCRTATARCVRETLSCLICCKGLQRAFDADNNVIESNLRSSAQDATEPRAMQTHTISILGNSFQGYADRAAYDEVCAPRLADLPSPNPLGSTPPG